MTGPAFKVRAASMPRRVDLCSVPDGITEGRVQQVLVCRADLLQRLDDSEGQVATPRLSVPV